MSSGASIQKFLRRPDMAFDDLPEDLRSEFAREIWELYEIEAKYEGYVRRQEETIRRAQSHEERALPRDFDYFAVPGLRLEAKQKLGQMQPHSFGQAGRVSGITPADLNLIEIWLKKQTASC